MGIELLKKNIIKHTAFTEKEAERFCNLFEPKYVKKKQYLLKEGEVCRFEAFVTQGLFKVFHLNMNGFEQILYFAIEDWWLADIDSFNHQSPSLLYFEALEDSEVLIISKKDKEYAYENIPGVEKLFRKMTQSSYVALQRRMIENLGITADERYLSFIEKYPQIAQRLTNIQIASYLGISHEFVSKIKKKIALKKQ